MKQKWIWSLLFLFLIVFGSVLIWQGYGEQAQPNPRPFALARRKQGLPRTVENAPEGTALAVVGQAPDFTLTERSGRSFSKSELLGKPWVADFIFTSCAGQCPLMSMEMRRLQGLFPKESGLQFVSVTVDPDRDKPEVLADYANRYEADKDRWFFLTGEKNEINRVLKEFFLSPVDQPAMHSVRFILVDQDGKIRGYYDSSEPAGIKQLIHDAKILTAKSSSPQ